MRKTYRVWESIIILGSILEFSIIAEAINFILELFSIVNISRTTFCTEPRCFQFRRESLMRKLIEETVIKICFIIPLSQSIVIIWWQDLITVHHSLKKRHLLLWSIPTKLLLKTMSFHLLWKNPFVLINQSLFLWVVHVSVLKDLTPITRLFCHRLPWNLVIKCLLFLRSRPLPLKS